jgi:hypothetical protein
MFKAPMPFGSTFPVTLLGRADEMNEEGAPMVLAAATGLPFCSRGRVSS